MKTEERKTRRYGWLDALRGLSLMSMILYHALWDAEYFLEKDWPWFHGTGAFLWQQSIAWTFILVSGFAFSLGHHPFRRGVMLLLWSGLIAGVTTFAVPEGPIYYGILFLLGASMVLTAFLRPLLHHIPAALGAGGSFFLFCAFRFVWLGYAGNSLISTWALPSAWYGAFPGAEALGFPGDAFFSADYYPILPWFFLFLTGAFLQRCSFAEPFPETMGEGTAAALLGRHSLFIYLIHQPLLWGIFTVLTR